MNNCFGRNRERIRGESKCSPSSLASIYFEHVEPQLRTIWKRFSEFDTAEEISKEIVREENFIIKLKMRNIMVETTPDIQKF